ncbi:MAG: class I SAM-dependent methyltransferase [Proteobacteria bacterium]|nr:class I SAM-dependent methyltransferase [Pseudomonadota bacterium]
MKKAKFSITFPAPNSGIKTQAEEYCIIEQDGQERRIRFHDYHEIYAIPGLYEHLFYERLKYKSPDVITRLLTEQINKSSTPISELAVFDLGAGNGIVGEILKQNGVNLIVGIDVVPEAALATRRDRPGVYAEYFIEDLRNLSLDTRRRIENKGLNCLVTSGALGFGDIPVSAFAAGYNLIAADGWIAFNIKEDFIEERDSTGFSDLVKGMLDSGILDLKVRHRYCHRLSVVGMPLYYVAVVGVKKAPIPQALIKIHELQS